MSGSGAISVDCEPAPSGWQCAVVVGTDGLATRHDVSVSSEILERMRPGAADPARLVEDAFAFLLEREPRESILRSFELPVIGRYFPEWESEMRTPRASG